MSRESAAFVVKVMVRVLQEIDRSIATVRTLEGEGPAYENYRRLGGQLMGQIALDLLRPIFREYPDLTPPQLRDRE
jgi:hypothetical protein